MLARYNEIRWNGIGWDGMACVKRSSVTKRGINLGQVAVSAAICVRTQLGQEGTVPTRLGWFKCGSKYCGRVEEWVKGDSVTVWVHVV